ncbi:MAG: outer membrane beta-barrel protein [Gallionella sp.]
MKLAKVSGTLGLLALVASVSPVALADDALVGWYGGANVGQSRAKIDDERISRNLLGSGFSSSISDDDRATGYKIFGGYQFTPYFALEGGYFDLGKFGYSARTVPAGTLNGSAKVRGLNLDLVGTLPITDKFSAFARIGVNYADVRDSFSGTGAVRVLDPNPSRREANYKFGLGAQYAFTERLAVRVEAERYRINDAIGNHGDIDLISAGLIYRFGASGSAPVARASAPEYIPVAAAPVPVTAVPVPPPAPIKVSFSADSLFDFGQSNVKPAGKQALDKFVAELGGVNYGVISVTGHTDRLGPHAYNMKLSSSRAEAVKTYLVQSAGIPADAITARGVNGSEPITKPGECQGQKATRQLIACLQPDRRVEVEVSGSR